MKVVTRSLEDTADFLRYAIECNFKVLCSSDFAKSELIQSLKTNYPDKDPKFIISIDDLASNKRSKKIDLTNCSVILYDGIPCVTRLVNHLNGKYVNIVEMSINTNQFVDGDLDIYKPVSCEGCAHNLCYYQKAHGYCDKCHNFSNYSTTCELPDLVKGCE